MRDKRQPITRAARAVGDGHIDAMEEARATGGDVGAVSKFGFLAAKMPSVLTRLRPMQSSSAGMLSYLFGPARIVGPRRLLVSDTPVNLGRRNGSLVDSR